MLGATPRTILIVAPNWLGDAVMSLPAIADVRRSFPASRLAVAARGPVADLFALAPVVDEVVLLHWKGGLLDRAAFGDDVERLRAARADVALLLPNSFASAWLVSRAQVPERWGYAADLRGRLLTRAIPRPRRSLHQGAYYQHLTSALGLPRGPLEPDLAVLDTVVAGARELLVSRGWDGAAPLVALAPGAAYGTAKRWIPSYVAQLVARLVEEGSAFCVLVGSQGDRSTTAIIRSRLNPYVSARVADLAGDTTVAQLAGVLRLARACVSNDSGAMHMAGAIGTPVVALFGPTREYETAPLTKAGGRADVLTHEVWCRPCMLRECPIDHRCMTGITPDRVYASVERLRTA